MKGTFLSCNNSTTHMVSDIKMVSAIQKALFWPSSNIEFLKKYYNMLRITQVKFLLSLGPCAPVISEKKIGM